MGTHANDFYSDKQKKYLDVLETLSQKLRRFAFVRFLAFLFIILPVFIFGVQSWITLYISTSAVFLFFFLIKKNIQLDKRKKKYLQLNKLAEDELLALSHSFSHFPNGKEFLDPEHFFSYDLDLFGEGSLFQFMNRTSSVGGANKLASWLIKPSLNRNEILQKQGAIGELSKIPNWRLHFLAHGNLFKETKEMSIEMRAWSELELKLPKSTVIKRLIWVLPILTILSAVPAVLGVSNLFLTIGILVQWGLMYFFWHRITQYFGYFGRKSELLSKYMQLLQFIEEREFHSEYLIELQNKVKKPEMASRVFKQLKSLVKEL